MTPGGSRELRGNWLSPTQAAERLDVPYATLLRWVREGALPAYKFSGEQRTLSDPAVRARAPGQRRPSGARGGRPERARRPRATSATVTRRRRSRRVAAKQFRQLARVGVRARLLVPAENEQRERRCVAADRRLRFGSALVERPASGILGAGPVAGEHERFDRPDRPAPAAEWCVGKALAVAACRAFEPPRGFRGPTLHQKREPRASRRVSESRQLALSRVVVGRIAEPCLPVGVPGPLSLQVDGPILVPPVALWFRHAQPPPHDDRIEAQRADG